MKAKNLEEQIKEVRSTIRTDGYPMSIGEWINLYKNNEIDIHPEFQRVFRWSPHQKTKLIESIILGIPIPPIFVSQRQDGVWDVVDGVQRLSTIYEFVGILKDDEDKDKVLDPLVLEGTKYLPALEGKRWEDKKNTRNMLTETQQLDIKRSKIAVSIIMKESDENSKYELFQRLNSGGSMLKEQEIRNCLLVMLNKKMFRWLAELASFGPFRETISANERLIDEKYDVELVLRFLIFKRLSGTKLSGIKDVSEFITDQMIEMAKDQSFDFKKEEEVFKEIFNVLNRALGSDVFRRYDSQSKRHKGAFLISAFEAIAIGLASNPKAKRIAQNHIGDRVHELWRNQEFIDAFGAGVSASSRIPKLIPLGKKWFKHE
jgi:uncharacterized protein with ParB-like and HNH nuclease domain